MIADAPSRQDQFFTAVLLIPFCLTLFAPGIRSIPPIDRDEPRFAQASRQMWQSGDYIDIRFQDEARHWKPIGIYWAQSAVLAAVGQPDDGEIWPYRIPSLVGATLAVIFTAWIGASMFGLWAGRLAGLMLAASFLLNVEARLATTDAALLAAVVAAQGALASIYLTTARRRGSVWILWIATAVAILLKGPVIIAVGGGTILFLLLFDQNRGWLERIRPRLGLLILLAIVGPWLVAIGVETGGAFQRVIVGDWGARLVSAKESHGGPPGYHAGALLIGFWPFSILSILAIGKTWIARSQKPVLFCLGWILPFWILCELMGTKLPHYVLPAYPAVALLTAHAVHASTHDSAIRPSTRPQRFAVGAWLVMSVGFAIAVVALPIAADGRFGAIALLLAAVTLPTCFGGASFLRQGRSSPAIACLAAAAVLLSLGTFGWVLPHMRRIWVSRNVAANVAGLTDCDKPVVASADFHEPSLVFLLGKETKLVGPREAAAHLLSNPSCALALITSAREEPFIAALREADTTPIAVDQLEGFNYSKGRKIRLTLYALETPLDDPGDDRMARVGGHASNRRSISSQRR